MLRRKGKRSRVDESTDVEPKRHRTRQTPEESELALGKLVFGDADGIVGALQKKEERIHIKSKASQYSLEDGDDDDEASPSSAAALALTTAWEDEDDELVKVDVTAKTRTKKLRVKEHERVLDGQVYTERLRTQFKKVAGDPSWAQLSSVRTVGQGSEGGAEADLLQRTQPMLAGSVNLPKDILEIKRVRDINWSNPPDAGIQSVQFHPQAPVVLTAGLHKTLKLHQVDNETNPVLHSMYMKNFPIHSAQFTADGQQVVMTSRRSFFYTFDIPSNKTLRIPGLRGRQEKSFEVFSVSPDNELLAFTGRDGSVLLVSNKTKQLVDCCRMSGSAVALAFTPSGKHLLSAGSDGMVYVWDVNSRTCCHSFTAGSYNVTSLAVGPDNQHIACGTSAGVVNVYDDSCFKTDAPEPLRTLNNLAPFCATSLQFNSSGEMLAMTSRRMEKGLRLAHLPSSTVFSNWPKQTTKLGYVQGLSFSPSSEYMAVGNDRGKALLFRLGHYKSES